MHPDDPSPPPPLGRVLLLGGIPLVGVVVALVVLSLRWPGPAAVAQGVADRLGENPSPGLKVELADLRDRIDRLTDQMVKHRPITDREIVDLTVAIGAVNAWNRLSIAFRKMPLPT